MVVGRRFGGSDLFGLVVIIVVMEPRWSLEKKRNKKVVVRN